MTYQDRIVRDPAICAGQPAIRGTRVLVRVILGYLAHGETTETILRDFPSLTDDDVRPARNRVRSRKPKSDFHHADANESSRAPPTGV